MSAELKIAEIFNKTFKKYPFLFQLVQNKRNTSESIDYISRNFILISQKIDALFKAPSIHDYILNFSKINSLSKIKERSLSRPRIGSSGNVEFYLAGNAPNYSDPKLLNLSAGKFIALKQKLINPLKELVAINDSMIEVDSVRFSLFIEQLVINFGIELCIAVSELIESRRSNYNINESLEVVEYSIRTKKDFAKLSKKERVDAIIEQGERFYPKVWELYTDNKKLIKCLSQHVDALQTAVFLEPYFLQTNTFHQIYSQIPIPTEQRFNFTQNFFFNLYKLKLPTPSLRNISRALLILKTFNPNKFKSEAKIHELIIPALIQSNIFKPKYAQTTVRAAYFATMRNHSGSKL